MMLYQFVKPLGIATYSALWITFLLGLFKFKFQVRWIDMKWHYACAIITVILATLHVIVIETAEHF